MAEQETSKRISVLTKTRFNELKESLKNDFGDEDLTKILDHLKRVMKFDPSKSSYTKELGQKMIEKRREKAKETGISSYVLCGGKANYEKKKQAIST
jgi:hypothetical protein